MYLRKLTENQVKDERGGQGEDSTKGRGKQEWKALRSGPDDQEPPVTTQSHAYRTVSGALTGPAPAYCTHKSSDMKL